MLNRHIRLRPRADNLAAGIIDGEAILVNLTSGVYYSLEKTGSEVWAMIEQGHSLEEMAATLAARYDTSAEQVAGDVERLAGQLLEEELVSMEDAPAPRAPIETPAVAERSAYEPPVLNIYRDMGDLLALDPPMPGLRDIPWQDPGEKAKS